MEKVRVLEGLVRYRFGENPELMAAWNSARNVFGPARSKGISPEGEGEVPPPPGDVRPAA